MKKLITITWLVICLIPIWAMAEEPVKAPAGKSIVLALSPDKDMPFARYEISLPGWKKEGKIRLSDEELEDVRGRAHATTSPAIKSLSGDSLIILWDDAKRGLNMNMSVGQNNKATNSLTVTNK